MFKSVRLRLFFVTVHRFKGSGVQGSFLVHGVHLGSIFISKASASSGAIQNLELNWQLLGKMTVFNEVFGSSIPSLSLTLNVELLTCERLLLFTTEKAKPRAIGRRKATGPKMDSRVACYIEVIRFFCSVSRSPPGKPHNGGRPQDLKHKAGCLKRKEVMKQRSNNVNGKNPYVEQLTFDRNLSPIQKRPMANG